MNLDEIDLAIINAFRKNARTTYKKVAEETGISTSAVQARFRKMKKLGLIRGSMINVNFHKLGGIITQMGIKTINSQTKQVVDYIYKLKLTNALIYCWDCIGHYNILCWIFLKDPIELHAVKYMIQKHPAVVEVNASKITEMFTHYDEVNLDHLVKR
jgi:Lrp/AsnC family transcriptional regulator for asnA, asnC and gidA